MLCIECALRPGKRDCEVLEFVWTLEVCILVVYTLKPVIMYVTAPESRFCEPDKLDNQPVWAFSARRLQPFKLVHHVSGH